MSVNVKNFTFSNQYMNYYDRNSGFSTGAFINCGYSDGSQMYNNWISLGIGACDLHVYGQNIYMGDSTIIHSSDERIKKDFKSLDYLESIYMDLKPLSYQYITGNSNRRHIGFKAQDIKKSLEMYNVDTKDFAAFVESKTNKQLYMDKIGYVPDGMEETEYGLRYEEFIALNTHMIQKLYKRIDELEKEISDIKSSL